jgi:uncharacterized protein YcfJ
MRSVRLIAIVVAVSAVAHTASAQTTDRSLVRVSHDAACCTNPFIGTLVASSADTIWIRPERASSSSAPIPVARRSVRSFERGKRVGAHKLAGAGLGFLSGVIIGGVMGRAQACQHCDGMGDFAAATGAVTGGLVGALTGTLIGAVTPHYEWDRAETFRGVAITPAAQGGMEMRVSLRY